MKEQTGINADKFQSQKAVKPWPPGGLEAVNVCPVCGSRERHLLYRELQDRIFFCAPGEWNLYTCDQCHSGYLDPRPTPETVHLAYSDYYTHKPSDSIRKIPSGRIRRIRRALSNGYRNWRFGTNLSPSSRLGIFIVPIVPGFRRVLEREGRNLGHAEEGSRLLDVGFGSGGYLDFAREAGWQVVGVDPDPKTVAAALERGFDVHQGDIFTFADKSEEFDVITLSHVIEHVHEPRAVLREVFRLLKPGGRVWLETPNIGSFGHKRFGRNWRGLEPPRHLVLFNWSGLEMILHEEGFCLERRLTRQGVYSNLATQSREICKNNNPYNDSVVVSDKLIGFLADIRTSLDYRYAEFITLMAQKPVSCRSSKL